MILSLAYKFYYYFSVHVLVPCVLLFVYELQPETTMTAPIHEMYLGGDFNELMVEVTITAAAISLICLSFTVQYFLYCYKEW
jgi:ABC-type transport system involved in cytochrome c biogenesis permease subunit